MNKKIMVLWAVVIVLLLTAIYLIGYSRKDKDYIKIESSIKNATLSYLKSNNNVPKLDDSVLVFVEDLINEDYIKDTKSVEKYCIKSVLFSKGLIKDKYEINIDCGIDD